MTPPDLSNSLLVAVDVQKGFVSQHSERALPNIRRLMAAWQAAGGTSVFTQFVNEPASPYVTLIGWSKMMADDPQVDFHAAVTDLAEQATAIVRKGRYSALTSETLEILREKDLRHIFVTGLDTESCVLATALGAFEAGFTPWLVTDASASHAGPREHSAGLLVAGRYIGSGQLVTTDRVLAEVVSQPPTPRGAHS